MEPWKIAGLCIAAVIAASAIAAQPPKQRTSDDGREFLGLGPAVDQQAAQRGEKIFAQSCAFCHGPQARGAEGPDLVRSSVVLHDEHGNLVGAVVLKGRPDRGMPAFPTFTQDQLRDVAEFLHSRVQAAANRFEYKVLNVVTGNAHAGEQFFVAHCASCHSATGDLAHIAKKFEPADLQAEFLYPSKSDVRPEATAKLHSGETVKGTVAGIDDFLVLIDVPSQGRRVIDRSDATIEIHDPLQGHQDLLPIYSNADMHNVLAYLETLQ